MRKGRQRLRSPMGADLFKASERKGLMRSVASLRHGTENAEEAVIREPL